MSRMAEQTLCHDCAALLSKSRAIIEAYESEVPKEVYYWNNFSLSTMRLGGTLASPCVLTGSRVESEIKRLIESVKDPTHDRQAGWARFIPALFGRSREWQDQWTVKLPIEFAAHLAPLVEAICEYGQANYDSGLKDGTNLLKRLAEGTLSLNEFETIDAKMIRKDQGQGGERHE